MILIHLFFLGFAVWISIYVFAIGIHILGFIAIAVAALLSKFAKWITQA